MTTASLILWLAFSPPADVLKAVEQLGAEEWTDREAAHRHLEVRGHAAILAVRIAMDDPDPEIARRAEHINDGYDEDNFTACEAAFLEQLGKLPCIDCFRYPGYATGPPIEPWFSKARKRRDGMASKDWAEFREATAFMLVGLRRLRVPEIALRGLLRILAEREQYVPIRYGGGGLRGEGLTPPAPPEE